MPLEPFSRENMRSLKSQKDEEGHQRRLEEVVKNIYTSAVSFAERKTETTYRFAIQNGSQCLVNISSTIPSNLYQSIQFQITKEYIVGNMDDILGRLRALFPECSVEYKKVSMVLGRDGKEYDISNLDEKLRPFIDTQRAVTNDYIVIDWT
jgi:DNA-binding ferritin-like protein (Dps family)